MKKLACYLIVCTLYLALAIEALTMAVAVPVYDGPELDYQPAIIRVTGGDLLMVIERMDIGDLYVTRSDDNGQTWSEPQAILTDAQDERHPSLLQLATNSFVLFYLKGTYPNYRIYRATSSDGETWTEQGMLDLGWSSDGEVNPNVIREADGTLTMVYHRLSGPAFIAQSTDNGATWDTLKTQVSDGSAALPRITRRESDGRYLVTYQVNPGNKRLRMYAKTTTDPYDWSATAIGLALTGNNHDSQPIVLENGTFFVPYARSVGGAYFDLVYRVSWDGLHWSEAIPITDDSEHYDTQPHPLLHGTLGHVILAWPHQEGATPYQDHDVWIYPDLPVRAGLAEATLQVTPETGIAVGAPLTFTLAVSNSAGLPVTAYVTDTLPGLLAYQAGSMSTTSGDCGYNPATGTITWTGTLATSETVSVTFSATTAESITQVTQITNTLTVHDSVGVTYEPEATAVIDRDAAACTLASLDAHRSDRLALGLLVGSLALLALPLAFRVTAQTYRNFVKAPSGCGAKER